MRQITINGHMITDDGPPYVIAEIGHNHGGDLDTCKRMFLAAKECGADAVKLQKRNNRKLYTKALYNSPYDNPNSYGKTYGEHREALEFGDKEYIALCEFAKEIGITFFATAFDEDSADFLNALDMPAFKVASGDLRSLPLIGHIAQFKRPMIISTGGATMEDVIRCHNYLHDIGWTDFAFLHCVASYPNKPEEMNLNVIGSFRERFKHHIIGLSDHYNGICMAEAAYVMGARIIEKHFTLDHTMKGTDHALSLQPDGLRRLCRDLKRIHVAMGDGVKRFLPSEAKPIEKMGKSVHVVRRIAEGERITREDVAVKSPDGGIPPYLFEEVIGKVAVTGLSTADMLTWEVLK